MMRLRSMSERRRVFLGLQGKRFPREGERGLYTTSRNGVRLHGEVEVVRVSPSGQTIWTRFVDRRAQVAFCQHLEQQRWWRASDEDAQRLAPGRLLYIAGGDALQAPYGEVVFPAPAVLPAGTL